MHEFEDNSETMQFDAIKEEPEAVKPQQTRSQNDEFTAARRGRGYEIHSKKDGGNGALIAVICILSVLLVGAIVTTIFILKGDKDEPQPQNDEAIVENQEYEEEESEEEEEVPEVQNTVISCGLVFYPGTIKEKEDGSYKIKADFLDSDGEVFETKRIFINEETDIRQDGERLALEGFIYYIEETNSGDKIIFKGEIKEEDDVALAISFETPPPEEEPEEVPEETPKTEFIDGETDEEPVEEVEGI